MSRYCADWRPLAQAIATAFGIRSRVLPLNVSVVSRLRDPDRIANRHMVARVLNWQPEVISIDRIRVLFEHLQAPLTLLNSVGTGGSL
jgi:hypothetical protein